jgi:hypothetical protein
LGMGLERLGNGPREAWEWAWRGGGGAYLQK